MENTIIVGAGMAGMSCALKLKESGRPYTIVSPNIGGRVCYLTQYEMNFGAVFTMRGYKHARKILTPDKPVLPTYLDLECHKVLGRGYGVTSSAMVGAAPEIARFMKYLTDTFKPHYEKFKQSCEIMEVREALAADSYMSSLLAMSADELIVKERFPKAADVLVSQFVHACTGSSIHDLNALDYLNCAMGLVDTAERFTFDSHAMLKKLEDGGRVLLESAAKVEKIEGGWRVTTEGGTQLEAENLVMTSPADVTRDLLAPIVGDYEIRNASQLYAYKVRGRIRPAYAAHKLHLFDESIPLINIGARPDGAYEVFTCEPLDMGLFFREYEIEKRVDWPKALFTNPSIIIDQCLGDGLYRAGDHNALGMEPAAISGVFVANRILGNCGATNTGGEGSRMLDKHGKPVPGIPDSYGNIDEQGNVLYLDAERLVRKEQPDKPLFRNKKNGIGVKNFLVTNLSARDWNWQVVLALFRKIVDWSAFMREPESLKSNIYKTAMYFSPEESTYSTGSIYNLNVDAEGESRPGTRAFHDAVRAENGSDAYSVTEPALREAHAHGREKCNVLSQVNEAARTKRVKLQMNHSLEGRDLKVTVPMDLVKRAIMEASYIGGMKACLCRDGQDCQNYPHDLACLFLNNGGKVVVEHGMAVELTKEEALARVDRAAELGLTCQSLWVEVEQLIWGFRNDEMDAFLEICFCCPCCCVALNLSNNATPDVKRRFSPTGWTAVVDHDACIGCKKCLDQYCPQDAIQFRESDGKMVVNQETCVGCGICRAHCPTGAISIKQTMPMRERVHDYFYREGRLDIVPGPRIEERKHHAIDPVLETTTRTAVGATAKIAATIGEATIDTAQRVAETAHEAGLDVPASFDQAAEALASATHAAAELSVDALGRE